MVKGRLRLALAYEQSDQRNPWTRAMAAAVWKCGRWRLRGAKRLARSAAGADALLAIVTEAASANSAGRERVFPVRPGATGLSIQAARCADGAAHSVDQRHGQRQARVVVNEKVMTAFACPLHLKLGGIC